MARVIKCDVCGSICKSSDALYLKVRDRYVDGSIKNMLHEVDICPECYKRVCDMLNIKAKVEE